LKINEDRSICVTYKKNESSRIQDIVAYANDVLARTFQSDKFSKEELSFIFSTFQNIKSRFEEKQNHFWIWIRNLFIGYKIQQVRSLFDRFISLQPSQEEFRAQETAIIVDTPNISDPFKESLSDKSRDDETLSFHSFPNLELSSEDDEHFPIPEDSSVDDTLDFSDIQFSTFSEEMKTARAKNFIRSFFIDATEGLDIKDPNTIQSLSTSKLPTVDEIYDLSFYPNLRTLSFLSVTLTKEHYLAIASLKQVKDITFVNVQEAGSNALEPLIQLPELTHLTFYNCSDIDSESLKCVAKITTLQELCIQNCQKIAGSSFEGFDQLKSLTHLILSYNQLSAEAIDNLNALAAMKQFTFVVRGALTDEDFINLSKLVHLTELDLDMTDSNPLGVLDEQMKLLKPAGSLEILSLRQNNQITDQSLPSIAAIASLKALDLHGTSITDEGVELLRGLKNLNELTLGSRFGAKGVKLTSRIFDVCKDITSLQRLKLFCTDISNDDIEAFKKENPSIVITQGFKLITLSC
jgi:hypothetical protein